MAGKGQSRDLNSDLRVWSQAERSFQPCPTVQQGFRCEVKGRVLRATFPHSWWEGTVGTQRGLGLGCLYTGVEMISLLGLGGEAAGMYEYKHHIALLKL